MSLPIGQPQSPTRAPDADAGFIAAAITMPKADPWRNPREQRVGARTHPSLRYRVPLTQGTRYTTPCAPVSRPGVTARPRPAEPGPAGLVCPLDEHDPLHVVATLYTQVYTELRAAVGGRSSLPSIAYFPSYFRAPRKNNRHTVDGVCTQKAPTTARAAPAAPWRSRGRARRCTRSPLRGPLERVSRVCPGRACVLIMRLSVVGLDLEALAAAFKVVRWGTGGV